MISLSNELVKGNISKSTFENIKKDIQNVSSEPFTYKTYKYAPIVNKQEIEKVNIYKFIPSTHKIFIKN